MAGRRNGRQWIVSATALAFAACESAPEMQKPSDMSSAVQDIDFARGCWVSRTGPGGTITGFLRLLPPGIDAPTIEGQLQEVEGGSIGQSIKLALMRDGSELRVEVGAGDDPLVGVYRYADKLPWTPRIKMSQRALFVAQPERKFRRIMIFEGEKDALKIAWTQEPANDAAIVVVVFEGERDGCD